MNISDHLRLAHERLSRKGSRFLDFVADNPGTLKRSNFSILDGMAEVGKLQSWPTFIDRGMEQKMNEAAVNVFDLIKSIPGRVFDNDPLKISRFFEIPEDVAAMQMASTPPHHLANLLSRGDFIVTPSGPRCLEFNVSANLGGMQVAYWQPVYAKLPFIAQYLEENGLETEPVNCLTTLFEHMVAGIGETFPARESRVNIAMVLPRPNSREDKPPQAEHLDAIYAEVLKRKGNNKKGRLIYCDYDDLRTVKECLYYKGHKIHALFESYLGAVPPEIMGVFKAGNLCLYNGPVAKLMSNKLNLALLSQHQHSDIFNDEEKETIKKYIPWTRKLIPGATTYQSTTTALEKLVFSHQPHLVLKPPMGISGADVFIGKNTPASQWKDTVERALDEKNWVVQEFMESDSYLFQQGQEGCAPFRATWGVFVFGSRYGGLWVRVLPADNPNGVINSIQGAEETVTLVLK